MIKTKIDWTGYSWNPITGCTPISEGCQNCYTKRIAQRLRGRYGYPKDDPFRVTLHEDRLGQPLGRKKPAKVFVCSMGDLFHEDVPDDFINSIFEIMESPFYGGNHHTYLILTKRPARILDGHFKHFAQWPNIWLGVTAENQKRADERVPILLKIPARIRFVSIEPILKPVILWKYFAFNGIHWVIAGCESGPGRRPAQTDWFRSLRDQCQEAGVPFFLKQMEVNGKVVHTPKLDGRAWIDSP